MQKKAHKIIYIFTLFNLLFSLKKAAKTALQRGMIISTHAQYQF